MELQQFFLINRWVNVNLSSKAQSQIPQPAQKNAKDISYNWYTSTAKIMLSYTKQIIINLRNKPISQAGLTQGESWGLLHRLQTCTQCIVHHGRRSFETSIQVLDLASSCLHKCKPIYRCLITDYGLRCNICSGCRWHEYIEYIAQHED